MQPDPFHEKPPSEDPLTRVQRLRQEAIDSGAPMTEYELQQSRLWWQRWTALKYLLLASRKLILWILGLGIGGSAFMDFLNKLIGAGGTPK